MCSGLFFTASKLYDQLLMMAGSMKSEWCALIEDHDCYSEQDV